MKIIFFLLALLALFAILFTGCAGNWDGTAYKQLPDGTHWYYQRR